MESHLDNNKYYVPEISEFHVGFEYEVMIPEKSTWSKEVFFLNDSHINLVKWVNIQDEFTIHKIRVKTLDKEDIESLGWKDCDNIYNTIRWDFNDYILMFYKKDNRYLIFRDCGPNNIQTVFNGFIKNKSELIKLQQQLDIK